MNRTRLSAAAIELLRPIFTALTNHMTRSGLMLCVEAPAAAAPTTVAAAPNAGEASASPAPQQPGTTAAATAPAVEGEAAKAEGTPAGSETAAKGAPETYTDFKLPEGIALGELAGEVSSLAKELNLSQEHAQKVVDVAAKLAQQGFDEQTAMVKALHADWETQTKADPEIGGAKLAENLAAAKVAYLATTTPQLQVLLEKSGLAHHPEMVRHFLKIAPAFTGDKFVPGGKRPGGEKTAANVLYPKAA